MNLLRALLAPNPPRLAEPDARLALAALLVRVARSDGHLCTPPRSPISTAS